MSTENDPTQSGGTESNPANNPRNAAMAQIASQAHALVAEDLQGFDEATGEIQQREEAQEPQEQQDAAEPAEAVEQAAPAEPAKPKMLTIMVDGQAIEVEESRIVEAGKRTLQKDTAADRRLQEAARERADAERIRKQAAADAEYIRQVAQQHGIELQAPSTDAPQQQRQATPAIDPAAFDAIIENKLYDREAHRAADKFREDFPEIASDPNLMQIAAMMEQRRLETAARLGEPAGDPFVAYRKHGEAVREWLKQRTVPATPAAASDKQERKRTITAVPAASARAPAPAAPKTLSVSEQIEQMRIKRMSGRTQFNAIR